MDEKEEKRKLLDKEIREKKLKIRKIKRELKQYRDQKFKSRMTNLKARMERINIEGLGRTKDELVVDCVKKLFQVQNFQDIIQTTKLVQHELRTLGCFKKVNLFVDTVHDTESEKLYQVNIKVEEIGRIFANFGFLNGKQDGDLNLAVRVGLNNLAGGGERLEVETTRGYSSSMNDVISVVAPVRTPLVRGNSKVFLSLAHTFSRLPFMPATQESRELSVGGKYTYSAFNLISKLGLDFESLAVDWTTLRNKTNHSWHPVVPYAGDRLVGFIKNQLLLDTLDNPLLPSHGVRCFVSQTAGFVPWTGDLSFHQVRGGFSSFYPLLQTVSVGLSGLLTHTSAKHNQQVPLKYTSDSRSPMVFRGSSAPNLYSGDLTCVAYNAALISKLPLLQTNSLLCRQSRFHAFVTGHLHRNDGGLDVKVNQFSNFVGIGVIGKVSDIGRFELNYTVPLGAGKPGLSFAFGAEFL